jgi:hypothetical protein
LRANLFLLKVALAIKLSRLGFDAALCHRCGKIFERTEAGETYAKNAKNTLKQEKPTLFLNHKTSYLPLVFAASDTAQRQLAAALRKL